MRAAIIVLATVAAGYASIAAAQPVIQAVPERPRIVVDGYGEVKTPPDLAVLSYVVRGEGQSSDDSVRTMTSTGSRIEAALHNIDAASEPHTSEVKVTPVKSADCKETQDETPQLSVAACAIVGYVATQSVTVRTRKVESAGTMVGLIGRGGGYGAEISRFELADPRAAQRQATGVAIADASARATAIAAATRVPLGNILSINTSSRDQGQEIIVTGMRELALPTLASPPPPVSVYLTPEPISTIANVTVTYAIGQ